MAERLITTLLIVAAVYTGMMMLATFIQANRKEYIPGHTRMQMVRGCLDSRKENDVRKIMIYNTSLFFFSILILVSVLVYVFLLPDKVIVFIFTALSVIGNLLRARYDHLVRDFIRNISRF